MKTKGFIVTGSMDVKGRPQYAPNGEIDGYRQKDGTIVRLMVALEVENKDGTFTVLTTDKQMRKVGFAIGLYDRTDFTD